ncbi:glycoside hydrolase superfamily [Podospora didyma]|uniref:chitinase n=1 Tax=Podospora didyma TaxID=330526 RepID=A0AAE0P8I4_9PEZI|nr:glycoside hydrolase superfamily [Podospora didyma]
MTAINAVYYPSWRVDLITYVVLCLNEDGTLRLNPSLKIILSIGGGSGSAEFPTTAAKSEGRACFARSARQWVDRYGFDDIDVDWEYSTNPGQGNDYIALLEATRAALPAPRHQAQLFSTSKKSGTHLTPRISYADSLAFLSAADFPNHKDILSIPAYARYFPTASAPGEHYDKANVGEIEYRDLPPEWICNTIIDIDLCAAYAVDEDDKRVKAEWVKSQGLGCSSYRTGVGDGDGEESLLRAGYEVLRSSSI